jgi:hypothetical protein
MPSLEIEWCNLDALFEARFNLDQLAQSQGGVPEGARCGVCNFS